MNPPKKNIENANEENDHDQERSHQKSPGEISSGRWARQNSRKWHGREFKV
jgi:hypothetical protein